MPTPKAKGYRAADGSAFPPSRSSAAGIQERAGWRAYSTGQEHGRLEALGQEAPASLYVTAKAADIGTAAHAMVEVSINGGDLRWRLRTCP